MHGGEKIEFLGSGNGKMFMIEWMAVRQRNGVVV